VLEPDDPHWQANLAQALFQSGNPLQSEIIFRWLVEAAPHLSHVHNNLANVLAAGGVPLAVLWPLFVFALETSETYADFQRHLMNTCASGALGDSKMDDAPWEGIEARSIAFLARNRDDSPDKVQFVASVVSDYRRYTTFKRQLSTQDWTQAAKSLDALERAFRLQPCGQIETERIRRFRPIVLAASRTFSLLIRLSSTDHNTAAECHREWLEHLDALRHSAEHEVLGSLTFTDLIGWFSAELVRQLGWLAVPAEAYDPDSHRTPAHALHYLANTCYAEIAEMFGGVLLQINRICRRTSDVYFASRDESARAKAIEHGWLSTRVTVHGAVGDFSGLTSVIGREMLGWNSPPLDRVRRDIERFRNFIEAQAHPDLFIDGRPQERFGRSLLQAFLFNNGFREVPSRGGRLDLLVVEREALFVIETKIWRGPTYHDDGVAELTEYVTNDALPNFGGAFYVVFDPTPGRAAARHIEERAPLAGIETVVILISPGAPSRKGRSARPTR
jgi:hypothetical protein